MHLVTQSMIQYDKPFCDGDRGRQTYLAHLGQFLMGVNCSIGPTKETRYVETHGFHGNQ